MKNIIEEFEQQVSYSAQTELELNKYREDSDSTGKQNEQQMINSKDF